MKHFIMIFMTVFAALTVTAETRIYKGNSTYSSDCIATFYNNKLHKGNSTYSSDCIFTFYQGKICKGNSTYSSDCVATFKNGKIYKGSSTYSSDCIMTTSEYLHPAVVTWMVYYCYRGAFL